MKTFWVHRVIVGIILVYLLVPFLATALFSFATDWQTTILPEGYTAHWFVELFRDSRFIDALIRSLWISALSVAVSVTLTVIGVYVISAYVPRLEKWFDRLAVLPFALPGVVLAVGLIQLYSGGPLPIAGTPWILIGAYFTVCLPFIYQAVQNGLRAVDANMLVEAAESLGAPRWTAFRAVVLPSVLPAVTIAGLLAFSIVFGEFVVANLLVGGRYETVQIFLADVLRRNGHLASAVVVLYFIVILVLSAFIVWLPRVWTRNVTFDSSEEGEGSDHVHSARESV